MADWGGSAGGSACGAHHAEEDTGVLTGEELIAAAEEERESVTQFVQFALNDPPTEHGAFEALESVIGEEVHEDPVS